MGQYVIYKALLDIIAPDHELYLAIDDTIFDKFFTQKATQVIIQRYLLALLVINPEREKIVQWIS